MIIQHLTRSCGKLLLEPNKKNGPITQKQYIQWNTHGV